MKILISGIAGSGKTSVTKLLAKKLGYNLFSIGSIMREMALERGISLLELSKIAENDKSIDEELDKRQIEIGKKEDNFVMDSRLGWYFIPDAVKVYLDATEEEAAKRILNAKREHETYKDINESLEKVKRRIHSEEKRYKEYYNIDYKDKKNHDIIVNTMDKGVEEVVQEIMKRLD